MSLLLPAKMSASVKKSLKKESIAPMICHVTRGMKIVLTKTHANPKAPTQRTETNITHTVLYIIKHHHNIL